MRIEGMQGNLLRPSLKFIPIFAAVASILYAISAVAKASETKSPRLGFLIWSAFECATYAEMAGNKELPHNKDEQGRLFRIGYDVGVKFLADIKTQAIAKKSAMDQMPWQVAMLLGGPTNEFIIGRIYQSASNDAFDAVSEHDDAGVPLAPSKYVVDPSAQASIAWRKYAQSNCQLIQPVER